MERESRVPIAVIGMSFQLPGGAVSAESLWSMMLEKRCVSTEFPADRLGGSTFYHPDRTRGDSVPLKGGHFLDHELGAFDAPFFSISASEAEAMDPQCRALLETTYRALENAGESMESISNSNTSVYTGNLGDDYKFTFAQDIEQNSKYGIVGMTGLLSGRLSWFFNLKGPTFTVDTACSSSLVALDLGCRSLLDSTADMSIVTGCSLLFAPNFFHMLSNMGMLSPDSKCFSFDHRANGYGRGEGIAVLVLKRLPDALRDNNTIRAVIRSTGVNYDGRTPGVTQPSETSQLALIRETYSRAGLSMSPTRYFEAHGTGTPVGDVIETSAIGAAFRETRSLDDPLYIGSVKSNIGHAEGASGLASVIKTILTLERGMIPPNANFETLNPKIAADKLKIKVAEQATRWPTPGLRRASVNSFGASGTNAHVILDDASNYLRRRNLIGNHCTVDDAAALESATAAMSNGTNTNGHNTNGTTSNGTTASVQLPRLLMMSAFDKRALQHVLDLYSQWMEENKSAITSNPDLLQDVAYTLLERRSFLRYRSFTVLDGEDVSQTGKIHFSSPIRATTHPRIAFVFTGQGAQWLGMGRDLLRLDAFHDSVSAADAFLKGIGAGWSILDVLNGEDTKVALDHPMLSQTLCTVLQIAFCDLYRAFEIHPSVVVGHSSGEIAAAYCVGAISRNSAIKLAYIRGLRAGEVSKELGGGMMAVAMGASDIQPLLKQVPGPKHSLTLACVNSPASVTVSGNKKQLGELAILLEERQVFHRLLRVDVAYHSPVLGTAAEAYKRDVGDLEPGTTGAATEAAPETVMISSVTGTAVDAASLRSVEYWVKNMLQPVLFSDAMSHIWSTDGQAESTAGSGPPVNLLVEIGPHSALESPIREILKSLPAAAGVSYYSSMKRRSHAHRHFLSTVGSLACHGVNMKFELVNAIGDRSVAKETRPRRRVIENLPEYPFDHSCTYLPAGRMGKLFRFRKHAKHDLLGKPVADWNPLQPRWRNFMKVAELPWVKDHKINNTLIYPAVGVLIMAIEAAKQLADPSRAINGFRLTDVNFMVALGIPDDAQGIETQFVLSPPAGDSDKSTASWKFRLLSHDGTHWQEHSHGTVSIDYIRRSLDLEGQEDLERLKAAQVAYDAVGSNAIFKRSRGEFYDSLYKSGYTFGPTFKAMDDISYSDQNGRQITASVNCFEWKEVDGRNHYQEHVVHPTTLDGILQVSLAAFTRAGEDVASTAVPSEIENLWIAGDGLSYPNTDLVKSMGTFISQGNIGYETAVTALDSTLSKVVLEAKGIRLRFVTGAAPVQDQERHPHVCYTLQWKPDPDFMPETNSTYSSAANAQSLDDNRGLTEAEKSLVSFIDLATFKAPDMKILHVTGQDDEERATFVGKLFESQDGHPPPFPCSQLVSTSTALEVDSTDMYDLVIYSYGSGQGDVDQAYQLLKPGGKFVMLLGDSPKSEKTEVNGQETKVNGHRTDDDLASQQNPEGSITEKSNGVPEASHVKYMDALQQAGFTNATQTTSSTLDAGVLVTALKPSTTHTSETSLSFVIVVEATPFQEEMAKILQSELDKAALKSTICYLDQLSASEQDSEQVYIFFSELEHPLLQNLSSAVFPRLRDVLISTKGLLWLSGSEEGGLLPPDRAMADGLSRVVRSENERAVVVTAVLAPSPVARQAEKILSLVKVTDFASTKQDYEASYVEKDGVLHIGRLTPVPSLSQDLYNRSLPYQSKVLPFGEAPPLRLKVGTPGLLDSLYFDTDMSVQDPLPPDSVEIRVTAVGLNFKDLLLALGRENGTTFGNECAGVIHRAGSDTDFQVGDRVCVFSATAFSTYTRAKAAHVSRVPDDVSLPHAAAVPTQFTTAWYAIHHAARMQKGESILIHSAAGGTGQAALQVAQLVGAEIFATVGSEEKKKFLVERYGIAEDHIFYSRNTAFARGVLRLTNGRGVDVVINSLSGDGLLASWELIAPHGRFIELGKKDIAANNALPMRPFLRRATFTALEIGAMAADFGVLGRSIVDKVLGLFSEGSLRPVDNFQTLPISQLLEGMRMLQSGQSIGKIVFEMADDALVSAHIPNQSAWKLGDNKTYVIAGGTGGLGLMLAEWMVKQKGARHLILLSRSGEKKDNIPLTDTLSKLRDLGAVIEAPQCDIADIQMLRDVIEKYQGSMPPIAGCIQGSMVLRDAIFANMQHDDWETSISPKTRGSWNLHAVLPRGLDFFVLLSSISGIVGTPGQANYAAGNAYMDALAHYRHARGERAVALDLGAMVDHGFLAANDTLRHRVLAGGLIRGIHTAELLALFDQCCDPASPSAHHRLAQVAMGLAPASELRAMTRQEGPRSFPSLPFYGHIFAGSSGGSNGTDSDEKNNNGGGPEAQWRRDFAASAAASDSAEAGGVVALALLHRLTSMTPGLQDRLDDQNLDEPIQTFGVDSLQAIELRSWFAREFAADVPIFVILGEQETLASIGLWVARKSRLRAARAGE
ncbi:ketoacyl-synt-domain-containing protein [Xylariomycetidae sp. FL2044]|nr:ketoacyl-synt-domain-containing protein [Xylariomycetidae sp. FL2044]